MNFSEEDIKKNYQELLGPLILQENDGSIDGISNQQIIDNEELERKH
jgi:hypothetical protein